MHAFAHLHMWRQRNISVFIFSWMHHTFDFTLIIITKETSKREYKKERKANANPHYLLSNFLLMHVFLYLYLCFWGDMPSLLPHRSFFPLSLLLSVSYGKSHLEFYSPNKVLHVNSVVSTWNKWLWTLVLLRDPSLLQVFSFHHVALRMASPKVKKKRKKRITSTQISSLSSPAISPWI